MRNFNLLLTFVVLVSCSLLYSCWDTNLFNKCESDYQYELDNFFGFYILDKKTNENVLLIGQTTYNYDTVRVYRDDWKAAYDQLVGSDGFVILQFIDNQKDDGVVDQPTSRRFYMYFNYQDIDTIDIAFEMKYNKCHDQVMKYFKVTYNDSVYFDGPTERVFGANFLK